MSIPLSQDIQKAYDQLLKTIHSIPALQRRNKMIEGTGGRISVSDLIAYQIGWGKCLIRWYEAGIKDEHPEMPGDGFSKWDYVEIAKHFYQKYGYDASSQQLKVFQKIVHNQQFLLRLSIPNLYAAGLSMYVVRQ
jgi:hypothetical protein